MYTYYILYSIQYLLEMNERNEYAWISV